MNISWRTETGHLSCRWSGAGNWTPYSPNWMKQCCDVRGSYLPPQPDFASHSPFGGPSWFVPSGGLEYRRRHASRISVAQVSVLWQSGLAWRIPVQATSYTFHGNLTKCPTVPVTSHSA